MARFNGGGAIVFTGRFDDADVNSSALTDGELAALSGGDALMLAIELQQRVAKEHGRKRTRFDATHEICTRPSLDARRGSTNSPSSYATATTTALEACSPGPGRTRADGAGTHTPASRSGA